MNRLTPRLCRCACLLLAALLTACATPPAPGSPTPAATSTLLPTSTAIAATAVPAAPTTEKHLTVCLAAEPESLYLYAPSTAAARAVQAAIYTPDFVTLSYAVQPFGLERLPSLEEGDAAVRLVPVSEGDRVVNARGDVVTLAPGEQLLTAGGTVETFDGTALVMEQQVVDFVMKPRTWSDGKPVTADDSVYSFELAADQATPGDKWVIDRTASYLATGTLRARWTGLPGFRDANFKTNFWPPAPRHTWRDLSAAELLTAPAVRMPIGDGPFQLVSWEPGAQIRLERNPFYFRAAEGFPRLDAVIFRFESDVNARLAGLLDGTCDIVPRDGLTSDFLPFLIEAGAAGLLQPVVRAGPQRRTLLLSAGDGAAGPGQAGPFAAAALRRATALCLDRAQLVARVAHGRSAVSSSYVPAEHPLFAADVARWPYDPLAANRLLDELGYADSDGDGLREQPAAGLPLQLTLLAQRDPISRDVADLIARDLRSCGLDLTLDLRDDFDPDTLDGRPFDLALTNSPAPIIPDCERYTSWQIGAGRREDPPPGLAYTGAATLNLSGWSDPAFDAACAAARRALPGTAAAQDGHQEAQRLFAVALPAIPLYLEPTITAARPGVLHLTNDPSARTDLWNLFAIDLARRP